ncbi:spermatogenesis-associated protein 19, mitochondrial isoform X1 [Callithrix jacchus]
MMQVQVSFLALAGKAKTRAAEQGGHLRQVLGEAGAELPRRHNEGQPGCHRAAGGHQQIRQPVGHDRVRHEEAFYDPKNRILPPTDNSTISLQMGINKCSSQVGMMAPGTRRHICDTELGTDKCDNSSVPLQMGYTQGANQGGQVFSLGLQIHDLRTLTLWKARLYL